MIEKVEFLSFRGKFETRWKVTYKSGAVRLFKYPPRTVEQFINKRGSYFESYDAELNAISWCWF